MTQKAWTFAGIFVLCELIALFVMLRFPSLVVLHSSTTFTNIPRSNFWLFLALCLMSIVLYLFAGIGGAICAGGILANAVQSPVVDYIHYFNQVCNLADVSIAVGLVWIAVSTLKLLSI